VALKRIINDILRERTRFLKFCVVGGSGVVVNLVFVWLGNAFVFSVLPDGVKTPLAYALGIVVSILTNFLFNYFWTWGDVEKRGAGQFLVRLFKFYVVSSIAAVMQFAVSNALAFVMKYHILSGQAELPIVWKLLFALIGIGIGMLINFFMNHYWTFKK